MAYAGDPTGTNLTSGEATEVNNSSPIDQKYKLGERVRNLRGDADAIGTISSTTLTLNPANGASGTVTIPGNLNVQGTTTTIDTATMTVDDNNIELNSVDSPSDANASGGGITLKGTTDKKLEWIDATDAWTFNQELHVQLDGAGALPTVDNDTVAVFQRNLPGSSSAAISVIGHVGGESIVKFGDADDEDIGRIRYQHTDNSLDLFTNNTQAMTLSSSQDATFAGDVKSDTGSVYLKEKADASADTAAYGQLWVNTATPNELYFTTDAGNDIQLTSGSAMAFVGDITGVTAGTGLSGGGTSGTVTLTVDAAQTQITSIGTIATGVWNGTAIASAYLDADTAHLSGTQTFTGTKTLNSFKGTGGATVTNILDEDAMGSNSATALATQQSIKAYADTKSIGTIATGVWNGTAIASAYLDADTAHLTGTQTFSGAKTFTGGVTIDEGELTFGSTVVGATGAEINAACDASARTAAAVAVASDHFLFCDGGATGATKVESIADLVTGIAGVQATTGLVGSSGTLVLTDLHPVGVNGSANQLLTDDGDGTVTSEANLSFASGVLSVSAGIEVTGAEADTITTSGGGGAVTAGAVSQSARKGVISVDLTSAGDNIADGAVFLISVTNAQSDTDSVIAVSTTSPHLTCAVLGQSDGGFAIGCQSTGSEDANFTVNYIIL